MKKYQLKYKTGETVVHLENPIQRGGDYAICGQDLLGDESMGWFQAQITSKKVNCNHCLTILNACKNFKH
jgi:hypothetical protein